MKWCVFLPYIQVHIRQVFSVILVVWKCKTLCISLVVDTWTHSQEEPKLPALPTSLTFWLAGLRLLFEPCGSSLLVNSLSVMFILSRLQPTLFNNWMKYPELSPVLGHSTEAASLKCAELAFSQASASCLSSVINPPVNLCQFNSVPVSNDFTNGQLQNLFSWSDQHFQWQKPDGQNICVPHPFSSATV